MSFFHQYGAFAVFGIGIMVLLKDLNNYFAKEDKAIIEEQVYTQTFMILPLIGILISIGLDKQYRPGSMGWAGGGTALYVFSTFLQYVKMSKVKRSGGGKRGSSERKITRGGRK